MKCTQGHGAAFNLGACLANTHTHTNTHSVRNMFNKYDGRTKIQKKEESEMGKGEKLKKFTWMAFAFTFKWFPLLPLSACVCVCVRVSETV